MGGQSKGRQRRARRERQKRARQAARQAAVQDVVGPIAAGAGRNYARLSRYVTATESPEHAAELARAELRAAIEVAVKRSHGIGIVHAVSALRVAMFFGAGDRSAAVLELVALALAGRPATGPAGEDAAHFDPDQLFQAAQEALEAGSMVTVFELAPHDRDALIVFHTVQREIWLRNPVYPHMLLDTLRRIFADEQVNHDCEVAIGFRGSDAIEVMEAVRQAAISELNTRFNRMIAAQDASVPHIEQWAAQGHDRADAPRHAVAAREVFDAVTDLTTSVDSATIIDIDYISATTGLTPETVTAVLDAYTLGDVDTDDAIARFFRGDNPLRPAPIVSGDTGRRMLVHDALALPALREVIETRLKSHRRDQPYNARRGKVTEDVALDLLAGVLPGATVHRGFDYFGPNPKSATPETTPEQFTKRFEGDGLLLIDDVAIIVEVKSAALTPEARGGVASRLRGRLRDIVTKAAEQADRLRTRIEADCCIGIGDDEWIDISNVREIHTVAVSLDDLSGVSTATAALIDAGLLDGDTVPWTVSVHDLRIICELIDRPSELLFYLRRRTNPDVTRKYLAVDELDLYLLALDRGLWVEPNPEKRAASMPWKAEASVAEKRRFSAQRREVVRRAPLSCGRVRTGLR